MPKKTDKNPFMYPDPIPADQRAPGVGSLRDSMARAKTGAAYTPGRKTPATPSQKVDAILDEAIAKRKAVSPKVKSPSESFNRMAAPSGAARPSREGYSFKPGSKADFAYTGVKPKGVSPRGPRQRTLTPPSVGSTPTTPAKPVMREPVKTPRSPRITPGRLFGVGVALNAGQAAYYEYKRRKNQDKKK